MLERGLMPRSSFPKGGVSMAVFHKGRDWYIDYYVNGFRKRERIGPNKRLAETVPAKRKVEIAEGRFLDVATRTRVRFEELAFQYLEFSKTNKRSWTRDYASMKHLKAAFGGRYLSQITPLMIEQYKAKRKGEVAPATVNREVACFKHMFTKAVEWGDATENPAGKVKLLRENNQRLRYLTRSEMTRLVDAASAHLKPIVITALNTGMRKGEILKLKWEDVDFRQRVIIVKDTKNGQWREIPINGTLGGTLKGIRSLGPYVFCTEQGKAFGNVRKSFHTALKVAGIEDFRFHDLRHTFGSQLVMAGVDLATVKELLGHKSLDMTMRYSHLSPWHKEQAVARLENQMDTNMDTSPELPKEGVA